MSDDIIDRLRCAYSKGDEPPCEACTFCVARAEIERLRAQVAELLPWDEDIVIGERIRERAANDNGRRTSLGEVAADFGIDLKALDADEQTFTKCCQGCDPSCDGPAACADRAGTEIERLRSLLDGVDNLHRKIRIRLDDGEIDEVCDQCEDLWPCVTHVFLHREEV